MKGGMGGLMKQAKQMQEQMQKAQEQLADEEVIGQAGGGMVQVTMTCKYSVRKVTIDPSLMEENDAEMLEDLMAAAMNDALGKVETRTQELMGDITGGLGNIPGLGDMLK
ncbi:MAG: YbaB/EbfC family nucleoid-associated protein [Thiohalorhabdus sp.]|uniref:YbaB/EbfC family nucleoid-associated protein n=1 Tax=Thiohalorhabdus sp. TaxID=3094134 RepID=UPI00398023D4